MPYFIRLRNALLLTLSIFALLLFQTEVGEKRVHAATIEAPRGSVAGERIEFRWIGESSETRFLWRVLQDGQVVDTISRRAKAVGCSDGGLCRFSVELTAGQYSWQIRPFEGNRIGDWTNPVAIVVAGANTNTSSDTEPDNTPDTNAGAVATNEGPPSSSAPGFLLGPTDQVSTSPIEFTWIGDGRTDRYLFRARQGSTIRHATRRAASFFGCAGGGTCRYRYSLADGTYDWDIRKFSNGAAGERSPAARIVVGNSGDNVSHETDNEPVDAPETETGNEPDNASAGADNEVTNDTLPSGNAPGFLLGPTGEVDGGPLEFSWIGDGRSDRYLFRALNGSTIRHATRRTASFFGCEGGGTCRYTYSLADGTYDWDVRKYRNGAAGERSPKARVIVGNSNQNVSDNNDDEPSTGSESNDDGSSTGNSDVDLGNVPLKNSNGGPFAGVYKTSLSQFQSMTGIPMRIDSKFIGWQDGWQTLEGQANWVLDNIGRAQGSSTLLWHLSHPMMPKFASDGNGLTGNRNRLQACAQGQYNDHYRIFANNLKTRNIKNLIIRLGWEFTVTGFPYGTGNSSHNVDEAQLYAECFRQFVRTVRSIHNPGGIIYEWNMQQDIIPQIMEAAYPGNSFVDIIGFDWYDVWGSSSSCAESPSCRWENHFKRILEKITAFANKNRKPLAIAEKGVWTNEDDPQKQYGYGDNPHWVEQTCKWIKANDVAYYIYFDQSNPTFGGHKHALADHPRSLQAFRDHCVGNSGNPSQSLTR